MSFPSCSLVPVLALVAAIALACDGCTAREGPHARNVIVLLIDTLRADHMSLYGYARDTTPRLSALARRAVVFERARSQAACTFPSVNSLLTSRHPARFLNQGYQHLGIPPEVASLPVMLRERGFATLAVSASAIVRATPSKHNKVGGFASGYDRFDESCLAQAADCINARTLAWLDDVEEPLFAYLHYMEPHSPYAPPPAHVRRFTQPFFGEPAIARGETGLVERTIFKRGRPDLITPYMIRHLTDLYDEEIAYLDTQLGALFEGLGRRGLLDDTLVVLAADHGEEFLEHGSFAHCRTVYDTETQTPLVFWVPGARPGRISTPVENLDLVPTILDVLGIPRSAELEGRSLRPFLEGEARDGTGLRRSMQNDLRSIDDGRYKVILDLEHDRRRVFDLLADPAEKADLGASPPAGTEALVERLHAWIDDNEGEVAARHGKSHGKRVEEGLRALGYLE